MKCQTLGGYLTRFTMLVPLSLFCLAAATLTGCGTPREQTSPPTVQKEVVAPGANLTVAEVLGIAGDVARQNGVKFKEYEAPEVSFDANRREWGLFYWHKPPAYPGGFFAITVNDGTMEARFHPGR